MLAGGLERSLSLRREGTLQVVGFIHPRAFIWKPWGSGRRAPLCDAADEADRAPAVCRAGPGRLLHTLQCPGHLSMSPCLSVCLSIHLHVHICVYAYIPTFCLALTHTEPISPAGVGVGGLSAVGCPVPCRVLSSVPHPHPPRASTVHHPEVWQAIMSPDRTECPLGYRVAPD